MRSLHTHRKDALKSSLPPFVPGFTKAASETNTGFDFYKGGFLRIESFLLTLSLLLRVDVGSPEK